MAPPDFGAIADNPPSASPERNASISEFAAFGEQPSAKQAALLVEARLRNERKHAHLRFFDDARKRFNHPPPGSLASAASFRPKRFIILRTVALSLSACRDI